MPKLPEPNYEYWDTVNRFDQSEVTCLWAGFEPSQEASQHPRVLDIQRLLEEAWRHGTLYPEEDRKTDVDGKINYLLWYWREELIAYAAEWSSQKPAFLFPDMRIASEVPTSSDTPAPLPLPNTSTANSMNAAMPVIAPSIPTKEESGLLRSEKQIREILRLAVELEFNPLSVPYGGKARLLRTCLKKTPELFGADNQFESAWREARKQNRVKTENHASYLPKVGRK